MKIVKCYTCGASRPDKDMAWYRGASGVCRDCVNSFSDREFRELLVAEAAQEDDMEALQAFEKMGFI